MTENSQPLAVQLTGFWIAATLTYALYTEWELLGVVCVVVLGGLGIGYEYVKVLKDE